LININANAYTWFEKDQLNEDNLQNKQTTNSVALVGKLTIPTERPPLVGEVSANFSG
jgi:hypothetical protein